MDLEKIQKTYESQINLYDKFGENIVESISILLSEQKIKFLSIHHRVKSAESFFEKIDRKSYDNPLSQIEDICGIRIICYYVEDIGKIVSIIKKEFNVSESLDKESNLEFDRFGYRSHHIIASIKPAWAIVPNYKGMTELKCEIQIRTVLMHAWAEIEHSLAYKSESQTPEQFKRKIHRISAYLEDADEKFEELKKESEEYRKELKKEIGKQKLNPSLPLNVDSLQAFMDANFPRRKKDIESTSNLVDQMKTFKVTLQDLEKGWEIVKPNFSNIQRDFWAKKKYSRWAQVGIARIVLDLTNEGFIKRHKGSTRLKERQELKRKYNIGS